MSETTVGGIVGTLRLDADQFEKTMLKALGLVDTLDGKDVNVTVDADTAKAEAQLARFEAAADRVDESNKRVSASSRTASGGFNALATAIVAVGPAIVPVAAGAAVLGAAFGGMGIAAIAAIKGISDQMEAGTALGNTYAAGVQTLKGDLSGLTQVAARNVLGPFQATVATLNESMSTLTAEVGGLATVAGTTGAAVVSGLVSAFIQLEPLMQTGAVYVQGLATGFQGLMAGPGVVAFGSYAQSVLPQVVATIESLVQAGAHVVQALAPLGLGVLSGVQALSSVISAIPTDVLTVLASGATAAYLGFQTFSALKPVIAGVTSALQGLELAEQSVTTATRVMSVSAGVVGVALAAASLVFEHFAVQSQQNQQAVDDVTEAFKRSHGAIDQSIKDMQYKALQDAGAIDAAKRLGIGLDVVTGASLNNADAVAKLNTAMSALRQEANNQQFGSDKQNQLNNDLNTLGGTVGDTNKKLADGRKAYQDYTSAMQGTSGAVTGSATAHAALGASLGATSAALDAAAAAQRSTSTAAATATLQMQYENNAAGLLQAALDVLNGKVLNVEQAQTRAAQATQNVVKTLHDNKNALDLTTAAGVANRSAIEAKVQADQASAEAIAKQTGSTRAGTSAFAASKTALENQLRATHNLTPSVQAYIDKLYAVPVVRRTKLELDAAAAIRNARELHDLIASLQNRTVTVTTNKVVIDSGAYAGKQVSANAAGSLTLGSGAQVVRAMAAGGTTREATIMRSQSPILWNEAPGGEAYIPLAPSRRARSTKILAETNKAMGDPLGIDGGRQTVQHFHIAQPSDPYVIAAESARIAYMEGA